MASHIGRRKFLATLGGAVVSWPLAVRGQQPSKLPMIGVIIGGTPSTHGQLIAGFVQRLRELGWIEDRTVAIEEQQRDREVLVDAWPADSNRQKRLVAALGHTLDFFTGVRFVDRG